MFLLIKNHVYLDKQNVLYNVHIDESGYIEKSEKMCIISSVNNTHNIHNVRCVILCIKWCIYGAYYGEMCMTYSVQRSAYIDKSGDGSVCALLLEVITGHSGAQPNILIPPFTITNTGIGNIGFSIFNIADINHQFRLHWSTGWQMLRKRRSPKGQGLLRKEGPPTYAILS